MEGKERGWGGASEWGRVWAVVVVDMLCVDVYVLSVLTLNNLSNYRGRM